jgi:localization factor PodJL
MVSEASWHSGIGRYGNAPSGAAPMDQQTVESLLRRLVQRVEESERRYSEALEELHARLDQLAQTTDAARVAGAPDRSAPFDRLHDEVSSLTRRLEGEDPNPLDDFERLGRALSGDLNYAASLAGVSSGFGSSSFPSLPSEHPSGGLPSHFPLPDVDYSRPAPAPPSPVSDSELELRLAEMAHRLENSVGTPMPPALDALSARLDEISRDLAKALETPKTLSLEPVERQISEMAKQLTRAESQLAKIGEIENALLQLIERVDASPSQDEVASKAAEEAARRVADEMKLSGNTTGRLDAMHRDLMAMNDRTKSSDQKLAGTIEAVHASLKELAHQVERAATPPPPSAPAPAAAAPAAMPRVPFAERMRDLAPMPGMPGQPPAAMAMEKNEQPKTAESNGGSDALAKGKPTPSRGEMPEPEIAPRFGRAKRGPLGEMAFDLDAPTPRRAPSKSRPDAEYEIPDDLVAAARRAAQAAAAKAEDRGGSSRIRRLPGDGETATAAELPLRRKRSFLIICAAVLLAISAALLYSRLRSKPQPEVTPPAVEQSVPAPAAPVEGSATPDAGTGEPTPETPAAPATPGSGSSELDWQPEVTPAPNDAADAGSNRNFTDVAKSPYAQPVADETQAQAQPASLTQDQTPALPPGVVFAVEDPSMGLQGQAPVAPVPPASPSALPMGLPLPPADIGPLPLRQAAAQGDASAQYSIGLRYAEGEGAPQNLTEAARWFERAASAGLAPAQYRLAVAYERGQGITKDLGRARSWYQAAAEKGNVKAMHNLAVSLSGHQDGDPDYALAAKWYGQAGAYGLADSQFNLAVLAEHGLGMPKNLSAAYQWFALAAKNGDQEAGKRRDMIKPQLDATALAAADQAVATWTAKQPPAEANEVDEQQAWADATDASAANIALVNRAQALLNKLGYDVGVPDGLMGAKTREAIKIFEQRNGLEETGEVTIPLVAKLERLTS